ncbi:MAG: NUDIX domain-containing protein [Nanoarchaeota archaeon]|nr:NUDIX domain-containing protein [Nanoarchaeota archaeon]
MEMDKFKIKVVGIIFNPKTRKILIGKNKEDEKYSFLEGNLTHKEELDKCLKRTITEKTGYITHNLGAIYAENRLREDDKLKIHFLCEATEGEEKPGENVEELIWVKPSEVENKLNVELPTRLHEYIMNLE